MKAEPPHKVSRLSVDDPLHYEILSQRQLIWRKFRRHRVAFLCGIFLMVFYVLAIFAEFFAPYGSFKRDTSFLYAPPTPIHFVDEDGTFHPRPFVYKIENELSLETFQRTYVEVKSEKYFVQFLVKGEPYPLARLHQDRYSLVRCRR